MIENRSTSLSPRLTQTQSSRSVTFTRNEELAKYVVAFVVVGPNKTESTHWTEVFSVFAQGTTSKDDVAEYSHSDTKTTRALTQYPTETSSTEAASTKSWFTDTSLGEIFTQTPTTTTGRTTTELLTSSGATTATDVLVASTAESEHTSVQRPTQRVSTTVTYEMTQRELPSNDGTTDSGPFRVSENSTFVDKQPTTAAVASEKPGLQGHLSSTSAAQMVTETLDGNDSFISTSADQFSRERTSSITRAAATTTRTAKTTAADSMELFTTTSIHLETTHSYEESKRTTTSNQVATTSASPNQTPNSPQSASTASPVSTTEQQPALQISQGMVSTIRGRTQGLPWNVSTPAFTASPEPVPDVSSEQTPSAGGSRTDQKVSETVVSEVVSGAVLSTKGADSFESAHVSQTSVVTDSSTSLPESSSVVFPPQVSEASEVSTLRSPVRNPVTVLLGLRDRSPDFHTTQTADVTSSKTQSGNVNSSLAEVSTMSKTDSSSRLFNTTDTENFTVGMRQPDLNSTLSPEYEQPGVLVVFNTTLTVAQFIKLQMILQLRLIALLTEYCNKADCSSKCCPHKGNR